MSDDSQIDSQIAFYEREVSKMERLEALEKRYEELSKKYKENAIVLAIVKAVCAHFNVSESDLMSGTRKSEIADARQVCMVFCCLRTNYTLEQIARCFNRLDHATVLHARKSVFAKLTDPKFRLKHEAAWKAIEGIGRNEQN